jgi:hypothetical protein
MTISWTIECDIPFHRTGGGAPREQAAVPAAVAGTVQPGRVPRVARLMALAVRFDALIRAGTVKNQAELARLGQVSRARISQILSLLLLAPDIQEALLFLPAVRRGRAPILLCHLWPIAANPDWARQRQQWRVLRRLAASRAG